MKKIQLRRVDITVKEGFTEFINSKQRDNLSVDTIKSYRNMYAKFEGFFDTNRHCTEITEDIFEEYKEYLKEHLDNVNTINTYLRNIRVIFNYFIEKNFCEPFKMRLLKVDETIKDLYTNDEIERMLKRPDVRTCSFSEYRTWVIINYILATGNRIGTVKNILIKDIDFEERVIYLRKTKNRKQYCIPLSEALSKVLKEYIEFRNGKEEDYLFCTQTGGKLTTSALQSAMLRYNRKRGIEKNSEHLLRHMFANLYYKNGGDVVSLNYILGHKDLKMTQHYLNLLCPDISDSYDKANPLDSLKKKERITMKR